MLSVVRVLKETRMARIGLECCEISLRNANGVNVKYKKAFLIGKASLLRLFSVKDRPSIIDHSAIVLL
jgi:hypothetical protein